MQLSFECVVEMLKVLRSRGVLALCEQLQGLL